MAYRKVNPNKSKNIVFLWKLKNKTSYQNVNKNLFFLVDSIIISNFAVGKISNVSD